MTEVVYMNAQQTRDNMAMGDLVLAVEHGFANFSDPDGGVIQPVRMVLEVENLGDKPSGWVQYVGDCWLGNKTASCFYWLSAYLGVHSYEPVCERKGVQVLARCR